jgi:hypothetical protein
MGTDLLQTHSTTPSVRDDPVDVSGAWLSRSSLLRRVGRHGGHHPDARDSCSWGRSDFRFRSGPFKGRGQQPLGESARAHIHLLVLISVFSTHMHYYVGFWVHVQCPVWVTLREDTVRQEAICDRTTLESEGFVSQYHIRGFSMKWEYANTTQKAYKTIIMKLK